MTVSYQLRYDINMRRKMYQIKELDELILFSFFFINYIRL